MNSSLSRYLDLSAWSILEIAVLLVEGILLLFVAISGGGLLYFAIIQSNAPLEKIVALGLITATAYCFNLGCSYLVDRLTSHQDNPIIQWIIHLNVWAYYCGSVLVYGLIILGLYIQPDTSNPPFLYSVIILGCIAASVLMGNVPRNRKIQSFLYLMLSMSAIHLFSLILRYLLIETINQYFYLNFAWNFGTLLSVLIVCVSLLTINWNRKTEIANSLREIEVR